VRQDLQPGQGGKDLVMRKQRKFGIGSGVVKKSSIKYNIRLTKFSLFTARRI
jgi:hypothetical protein